MTIGHYAHSIGSFNEVVFINNGNISDKQIAVLIW